jgi:hypothetical protein
MKKTLLALALAAGLTSFAGNAKAGIRFTSYYYDDDDSYENVISYNALSAGTKLDIFSSDIFHYYGPYNTKDHWDIQDNERGAYFTATLLNNTSGDSFQLYTATQITDVKVEASHSTAAVPEPSQVAASLLLAAGIAGFVIVKRRKEASELEALAA